MPVLLNLGHGYSAARLAARLPAGWRVMGTTRSPERAAAMRAAGMVALDWEDRAAVSGAIAEASHVLVSAAPGEAGDPVLLRHAEDLAAARDLAWVGYLSTTGVYGDRQGGWVDEESARDSQQASSRRRAAVEDDWLARGLPAHVFRLVGIYGPGRSAIDRLRRGTAQRVVKPGQIFNRIHVEDIANVLLASIARPRPGGVYNVADDEPGPPEDVIAFAAGLLGVPVPPAVPIGEAGLSPMAASFYAESRRVSNRRIKEELGVALAYPDYRAGLRAILAETG